MTEYRMRAIAESRLYQLKNDPVHECTPKIISDAIAQFNYLRRRALLDGDYKAARFYGFRTQSLRGQAEPTGAIRDRPIS